MENGPVEDVFPIENGGFSIAMLVYWRVGPQMSHWPNVFTNPRSTRQSPQTSTNWVQACKHITSKRGAIRNKTKREKIWGLIHTHPQKPLSSSSSSSSSIIIHHFHHHKSSLINQHHRYCRKHHHHHHHHYCCNHHLGHYDHCRRGCLRRGRRPPSSVTVLLSALIVVLHGSSLCTWM